MSDNTDGIPDDHPLWLRYDTILDDGGAVERELERYRALLLRHAEEWHRTLGPSRGASGSAGVGLVPTAAGLTRNARLAADRADADGEAIDAYRAMLGSVAMLWGVREMPPVPSVLLDDADGDEATALWWAELLAEVATGMLDASQDDR